MLSGGSAFGLDAASAVANELRARGPRLPGRARPGADRAGGRSCSICSTAGRTDWIDNLYYALGREAFAAASETFELGLGRRGARGRRRRPSRVGSARRRSCCRAGATVGALVAVNPHGTPLAGDEGHFLAAAHEIGDEFRRARRPPPRSIRSGSDATRRSPRGSGCRRRSRPTRRAGTGAGDAAFGARGREADGAAAGADGRRVGRRPRRRRAAAHEHDDRDRRDRRAALDKPQLKRPGGRRAGTAWRARSPPSHTPSDGDLVFALSTGERPLADPVGDPMTLGHVASLCLARAIARGGLSRAIGTRGHAPELGGSVRPAGLSGRRGTRRTRAWANGTTRTARRRPSEAAAVPGIDAFVTGFVGYRPTALEVLRDGRGAPGQRARQRPRGASCGCSSNVPRRRRKAEPWRARAAACTGPERAGEKGLLALLEAWQRARRAARAPDRRGRARGVPAGSRDAEARGSTTRSTSPTRPAMLRLALGSRRRRRRTGAPYHSMLRLRARAVFTTSRPPSAPPTDALAIDPAEPWAHHALSHGPPLERSPRRGPALPRRTGAHLGGAELLHVHPQLVGTWRCFEIAAGEAKAALATYDDRVWGVEPDCSQDQINAVSLLARGSSARASTSARAGRRSPPSSRRVPTTCCSRSSRCTGCTGSRARPPRRRGALPREDRAAGGRPRGRGRPDALARRRHSGRAGGCAPTRRGTRTSRSTRSSRSPRRLLDDRRQPRPARPCSIRCVSTPC